MKLNIAFLTAALIGATSTAWAGPICEVVALRGEARLGNAGPTLSLGQKLETGAEIRTGANGRVRLRFDDGSTLVVSDNSQLRIERFDAPPGKPREATMALEVGLIGQQVVPQQGGKWEVRTPTAVTAVRGTEFFVEVGQDMATAVSVQSGAVDVEAVESAAGGTLRRLHPASKASLSEPRHGTDCKVGSGCTPTATWGQARYQAALERLSL